MIVKSTPNARAIPGHGRQVHVDAERTDGPNGDEQRNRWRFADGCLRNGDADQSFKIAFGGGSSGLGIADLLRVRV
jgi:hypothetical protein